MLTLPAFIVAIALLIAIHEYGHYRMARSCGVKVLRFSIGFGRPLWRRQAGPEATEFVVAMIPLGGFVKMLDEREGPVDPAERHLAFNTQPLARRAAIVAAGPLANLVLALALYSGVNWIGVELPQAILSQPTIDSLAAKAGLLGGEKVLRVGLSDDDLAPVRSFEDVRWQITRAALKAQDLYLEVSAENNNIRTLELPLSRLHVTEVDARLFAAVGISAPFSRPIMGDILADGAAARAGLEQGDEVLTIDGQPVVDGQHLRQLIRNSVRDGQTQLQHWRIVRQGQARDVDVLPALAQDAAQAVGRVGAYVGAPPAMAVVRYGLIDGVTQGLRQTWDMSTLTLTMMGRMLVGEASVKNISGPLTIAEFAGKSAGLGVTQYLVFLALVSVSLGVLNLLPVPVLDGGHLMYYLWEAVTGRPVTDPWMERLQQGGIAVLMVMMSIALFNDINRLLG